MRNVRRLGRRGVGVVPSDPVRKVDDRDLLKNGDIQDGNYNIHWLEKYLERQ